MNNGSFANGRLYSFNADLTPRWSVPITNINIGGPAIAADGTLVVCSNGTQIKAYYTPPKSDCPADTDGSGAVDVDDLVAVILGWGACAAPPTPCPADTDGNDSVDVDDLIAVILGWGACP